MSQKPGFHFPRYEGGVDYEPPAARVSKPVPVIDYRAKPGQAGFDLSQTMEEHAKPDERESNFIRLLCLVYGIEKIEDKYLPALSLYESAPDSILPATINDPLIAVTPSGALVEIRTRSVTIAGEAPLDPRGAMEMALLAAANPANHSEGVTIEGTPEEMAMYLIAARHMGLTVNNLDVLEDNIDQATFDRVKQQFEDVYGRQKAAPRPAPQPQPVVA